ncbi:hypothetical protein NQD34_004435 [Periophthalmus magnuspinnatus]|nr:hypothetical protein NQD34_004435 [Periophthalmus magnuspinnatus]
MDPPFNPEDCTELLCGEGCGLLLSAQHPEEHSCVEALRALADELQDRSSALEHEGRMARLGWERREQWLMARATTAQTEAKLARIKYQRRLHQYTLHVHSIMQQALGLYQLIDRQKPMLVHWFSPAHAFSRPALVLWNDWSHQLVSHCFACIKGLLTTKLICISLLVEFKNKK